MYTLNPKYIKEHIQLIDIQICNQIQQIFTDVDNQITNQIDHDYLYFKIDEEIHTKIEDICNKNQIINEITNY